MRNTIRRTHTILLPQLFLVSSLWFTLESIIFVHSFNIIINDPIYPRCSSSSSSSSQPNDQSTSYIHTSNRFMFSLSSSQQREQDETKNNINSDNIINNNFKQKSQQTYYTIHIKHENKIGKLIIHETETILQALERSQNDHRRNNNSNNNHNDDDTSRMLLSSLPSLPQECRKGNCLTCAAAHLPNSNQDSVITIDDGLSPFVKRKVNKKGYVQTCSSYVRGDDVWLELDVSNDVWNFIWNLGDGNNESSLCSDTSTRSSYDENDDENNGERIRNEAMAKCIRMADERNFKRWVQKTERMLD